MTTTATTGEASKAPFPWFGGKSRAAPAVWEALGDPDHYVEPFAGSLAVLLQRPHLANRTYYSETVNDADGLLVNAWRSIHLSPDATAKAASNPVAEADLHARHLALVRWRESRELEHLMGDPEWHDPVMGGWWLWGVSCWIGGGWCSGRGPWIADDEGRLVRRGEVEGGGVEKRRPQLTSQGQGVNRPQLREPGVERQLPHLANDGQGVNTAAVREPGIGEFHPITMPRLRQWFGYLSARLRHVRILNGDWRRSVTGGATKTIPVRMSDDGVCGVFLDPPYADTAKRQADIYATDCLQVAHDVREWALEHGEDPDYRIVFAGFDGEHGESFASAGWSEFEWYRKGWLNGGMGNVNVSGERKGQQERERLFMSPHCIQPTGGQGTLW